MNLLDDMAERKIQTAIERGELDDLEGSGKPLQLEDDRLVPPDLRTAYRLLKNAGCLPPEIGLQSRVREVEDLLRVVQPESVEYTAARKRLELLRMRLSNTRAGAALVALDAYAAQLETRLSR